jgi:hypothetical protein
MPELEQEITEAFERLVRSAGRNSVIVEGFIIDTDLTAYSCTVNVPRSGNNGEAIDNYFYKVPMKILLGSQASFIEVPAVTSRCLLTFKDNSLHRPQLYLVDKCAKILIKVDGSTLEINTGKDDQGNSKAGFIFNEGKQGNMILLDKCVQKLNNLEQDINKLKKAFTTWVVVPHDGGAALKAASATWSGSSLTETKKDDLSNKNILQ